VADTNSGDEQKQVYAGTDFGVSTHTGLGIDSGVVGVAASKTAFSGAGSVDFMLIDNNNQAYVSGMQVYSDGALAVTATDNVDLLRAVGGLAGSSGAGAAAAVMAVVNDSLTEARVLNSVTNASGATTVQADSTLTTDILAGSAALALKGAFNGTFVVYESHSTVRAVIESNTGAAQVNQDPAYDSANQTVVVRATDDVTLDVLAGGASAAFVGGVGGTLVWLNVQNTVDAHIGSQSLINAVDSVTVEALSTKDIKNLAGSLYLGGGAGITGTFIITTIGSGVSSGDLISDVTDDMKTHINESITAATSLDGLSSSATRSEVRDAQGSASLALDTTGTINRSIEDVGASIDASSVITAGGNLIVNAKETIIQDTDAGTAALALAAGVGGSVSVNTVQTATDAIIGDNVILAVEGDISITANADESLEIDAIAAGGSVLFSVGAQYASADVKSEQRAQVGAGVNVLLADEVKISADHIRDIDVVGTSANLSGIVVGVSNSVVDASGKAQAIVGENTIFGQADATGITGRIGSLSVLANGEVVTARAKAPALAGGIAAGFAGAIASSTVAPTIYTRVGSGTAIYAEGTVSVQSTTDMSASSDAPGGIIVLGASFGYSDADTLIAPDVDTEIRTGAKIDAAVIDINALHNTSAAGTATGGKATASASSSGGAALLSVLGSEALARSEANVALTVFDASFYAATGDVSLRSRNHNNVDTTAFGDTGAIIGVGLQTGDAEIVTATTLSINHCTVITSENGSVTLLADSDDDAVTDVEAGSGGVVAVSEAESDIKIEHSTDVTIGDGAIINAENTLSVIATADVFVENDADAISRAGIAIPTTETEVEIEGPSGFAADATTEIGASDLSAAYVVITAEFASMDLTSDANAEASAIGADSDATSRLDVFSIADVTLTDTVITGGQQVDLLADHTSVAAQSNARGASS
ncbi:MAG: hypothetical protein AAGF72_19065, partial [Pseudomonadota bacterium]